MTAPAGIVPVSDDRLLARLESIAPVLRDMAATGAQRDSARLALECVESVIRDIRVRAITGHP